MTQPVLRVISGNATPDEVAAIVAALASIEADRRVAADPYGATTGSSPWVEISRRTSRAVPSARGSWRLAGRVPRRLR